MPSEDRPKLRCFLVVPSSPQFNPVREAIIRGADEAGFQAQSIIESPPLPSNIWEIMIGEIAQADCIIVDLSSRSPSVFVEIGQAQAMGKPLFLLIQKDAASDIPASLLHFQYISYELTPDGLSELTNKLAQALEEYRRFPHRARSIPGVRLATPFFVDWDQLDHSDAENLCRELLTQMGYRRVDWSKEIREIDLIAELPKKDPDGYEYRELWFVAMGRNIPQESFFEDISMEPGYYIQRLLRYNERLESLVSREIENIPITLLFILLKGDHSIEELDAGRIRMERRMRKGRSHFSFSFRIRIWDRNYLTSLVQQFPQLGYKYFSDEGRSRSKFRKTPEELYKENVDLTNQQTVLIIQREDEKNKRVRAERDAIWKGISFAAAHKLGNPIFAIETNLDPLKKRINESRTEEAFEVISSIRSSVEKAKSIIEQFKSLTRAEQINPTLVLLRPILEDVCRVVQNQEVVCEIDCSPDVSVLADPDRLAECFDELAINATHWFDKPIKEIQIQVSQPALPPLPQSIDSSKQYMLIHFKDNGVGVELENKDKIFDAFFTTRDQGNGLGLAYVRRIIEGHGGAIFESGLPGQGADFEIYLPLAGEPVDIPSSSTKQRKQKRKE